MNSSGSSSWSITNANASPSSRASRTERGIPHISANLALKLSIRPSAATTRIPSAVESRVVLSSDAVCASSSLSLKLYRESPSAVHFAQARAGEQLYTGIFAAERNERRADAQKAVNDRQRPLRRRRHPGRLAQLLEEATGVSAAFAELEDLVESPFDCSEGDDHAHDQAAQKLRPAVMEDKEVERLGAQDSRVYAYRDPAL